MRAVIMAGGEARRFWGVPKPLMRVCGRTMLASAVLAASAVAEETYVAAPPRAFAVIKEAVGMGAEPLITPGLGYSLDLAWAVSRVGTPALIIPSDMPFLGPDDLRYFLGRALVSGAGVVSLKVSGDCFPPPFRGGGYVGLSLIKGFWGSYSDVEACRFPAYLDVDSYTDYKEVTGLCA